MSFRTAGDPILYINNPSGVPTEVRRQTLDGLKSLNEMNYRLVGDPAIDYAWLLNVPFPDWEVDDELRRRALVYHGLEPWLWVHYGVFTDQPEWVRSGLTGVRSRL